MVGLVGQIFITEKKLTRTEYLEKKASGKRSFGRLKRNRKTERSVRLFGWQINGNVLDSCPVAGFVIDELGLLCYSVRK
jgi:hypothetical protein